MCLAPLDDNCRQCEQRVVMSALDAVEYSNSTVLGNMDKVLKAQRETNKWVHAEVHLIKFLYDSF